MGSKEDILNGVPVYIYQMGRLRQIETDFIPHNPLYWSYHHYIPQSWIKRNPDKYEAVKHLQKLFVLPCNMHAELHARHSRFEQKYGLKIGDLLWN